MKDQFPRADAVAVARELCSQLIARTQLNRLLVCGSLRRRQQTVGDVEIVFVPLTEMRKVDLISEAPFDLAADLIREWLGSGVVNKRLDVNSHPTWGPKNKLSRHAASGIAVDFFSVPEACWWNAVVMRTGGKQNNIDIATAANDLGWKWNVYDDGFTKLDGSEHHVTTSERDAFEFVHKKYLEPWERP